MRPGPGTTHFLKTSGGHALRAGALALLLCALSACGGATTRVVYPAELSARSYPRIAVVHGSEPEGVEFANRLLEQAYVSVVPGLDFGHHQPSRYVRLSYATPMDKLEEAVARLGRHLPRQTGRGSPAGRGTGRTPGITQRTGHSLPGRPRGPTR